uniref:Uncharacterized protein n=1 Tax=Lactuca sativa TaxID=4236 RepID=A0A9R1WE23_LACSA|nr:hypothetical protein LSAT_V11C200070340 [Lactuca sativa]
MGLCHWCIKIPMDHHRHSRYLNLDFSCCFNLDIVCEFDNVEESKRHVSSSSIEPKRQLMQGYSTNISATLQQIQGRTHLIQYIPINRSIW